MSMLPTYRLQARYNRWFNQRLLTACDGLDDAARKKDCAAFFGSLHNTLNHLLLGDQLWLRRFVQCGQVHGVDFEVLTAAIDLPQNCPLDLTLYDDWTIFKTRREDVDTAIEAWLVDAPADMPDWTMRYANSKGVPREHPLWQALTHFFNHQTHHRGQVTTLLAQAGVDVGVTDLIALV
jgi:uncharacterized damage-inducible protein DinB